MLDLKDLYQEVIIDHSKRPRHFGKLADSNREAEGFNPLCGDRLTVKLIVEDGLVKNVAFEGVGCAISTASASMMTDMVIGKTEAEARALFQQFQELVTRKEPPTAAELTTLDKLAALTGVRAFPSRVKCATLAWHTLAAALDQRHEAVKTE
ncbi:MAG: SUF system NifU family Fe-S cluster assembly protein [Alphaproteobacteria bacterium]|nr:SUF system NifU family Fe-S cluster assembly protein [Alphaproteobacteria bacterium]